MRKCPRCKSEIGSHDIKVVKIAVEYVEIEMYCDSCDDSVAFARIGTDDWVETE